MSRLNDDSFMPYGKHQGTMMTNVPADYLLWCYDNNKIHPDVAAYVKENIDVLRKEVEK